MITSTCDRSVILAWLRPRFALHSSRSSSLRPGEWLLYWKTPELAPARRRRRVAGITQLPLFDVAVEAEAMDQAFRRTRLQLVVDPDAHTDP